MEGCATKQNEELRGNRDTNTIHTHHHRGLKHKPRPRRSIAGPSGQVSSQEGHNKHPVEGLRQCTNQDRKTTQHTAKARGQEQPKARKTGVTPPISIPGSRRSCCMDSRSGMKTRVPEARGGDGTSTQPQGTASVQGRKAQTYVPVRDK